MSVGTATNEQGVALAERLGLTVLGDEGPNIRLSCPVCAHKDAFRIHRSNRAMWCHACKVKDPLAIITKILGSEQAAYQLMTEVGMRQERNNTQQAQELLAEIARIKRTTVNAIKQMRGYAYKGKLFFPMYGPELLECVKRGETPKRRSLYYVDRQGVGNNKSKTPTGLFIAKTLPDPGDNVAVGEGPFETGEIVRHFVGQGKEFNCALGLPGSSVKAEFAEWFRGCHVYLIPDADKGGDDGVIASTKVLQGIAASVRKVRLPVEWRKKDGPGVREALAQDNGLELIRQAIANAPECEPSATSTTSDQKSGGKREGSEDSPTTIGNVEIVASEDEDGKETKAAIPLPISDILTNIFVATEGWPKTAGGIMFVHDETGVHWLGTPAALFGWLQSHCGIIDWRRIPRCVSKEELFSELKRIAEKFIAIETLPHIPAADGIYYATDEIPPGDGATLNKFLDRFTPDTPTDRELLKALMLTLIWGGPPGSRPAFLITSTAGRGAGKSAMAGLVSQLFGGCLDFSSHEDIGKIKTRLLGSEALTKRVALLDNIKSSKFSWAELEALITSPVISGHRMYHGEFARPNFITWILTLNGPNLSADMAQRVVPIRLKKPSYSGEWADETRQFITDHRLAIIGDLIAELSKAPAKLAKFSRWGLWEREILARTSSPADTQKLIEDRQTEFDSENEEIEIIEEFFAKQLAALGYMPQIDKVFLPSEIVRRWYGWCTGDKKQLQAATQYLGRFVDEGKAKHLTRAGRSYGRGFFWFNFSTCGTFTDLQDRIKKAAEEKQRQSQEPQEQNSEQDNGQDEGF